MSVNLPENETTIAAVSVLQAELNLVNSNLDGLDRKTALLPPFLGVVAGLTLPQTFTTTQALLVGAAVLAGIVSVFYVFRVLLPSDNPIGPTAQEVAATVHIQPVLFRAGVARALATSIDQGTARSKVKASDFRLATAFASIAILLLIGARLLGAISMTDQNQSSPPPSSPAPSAPVASPSEPASPAPPPSAPPPAPATGDQSVPVFGIQTLEGTEPSIPIFSQQESMRSLDPSSLQTLQKADLGHRPAPPPEPPASDEG